MPKENKTFEFGPFRLEVGERRLTRDGHSVPLRGRVLDTLVVLVSRRGSLATKDELIAAVWPDSVVEETNLNHNICVLRRALGEKATGQKYIETVPRQGYRFVAVVTEVDGSGASSNPSAWNSSQDEALTDGAGAEKPAVPSGSQPQPELAVADQLPGSAARPRRIFPPAIIALLLVAGILAVAFIEVQRFQHMPRRSSSRTMLAVLPFENLTGNPAENYISDGFHEEIISQLAVWNPSRLGVIGRTSSKIYRETKKSIGEIGLELGVDYIVEGSVRTDGKRIRISVLLIRVNDQSHLWAANYDGNRDSVLDLQIRVTQDIIRGITTQLKGGPEPSANRHLSPDFPAGWNGMISGQLPVFASGRLAAGCGLADFLQQPLPGAT